MEEFVLYLLMLAQSTLPDIVSGTSLAGTIINGGVLVWLLMKGLPDKDALIKDLLEKKDRQLAAKDEQMTLMMQHKWDAIQQIMKESGDVHREMAKTYRQTLQEISNHCEKEAERLIAVLTRRQAEMPSADDSVT